MKSSLHGMMWLHFRVVFLPCDNALVFLASHPLNTKPWRPLFDGLCCVSACSKARLLLVRNFLCACNSMNKFYLLCMCNFYSLCDFH